MQKTKHQLIMTSIDEGARLIHVDGSVFIMVIDCNSSSMLNHEDVVCKLGLPLGATSY